MTPALPPQETLTIEFKSDRNKLADRDLIEAITCLANTDGGELWLGVEDDGTPTGLHPDHQMVQGVIGLSQHEPPPRSPYKLIALPFRVSRWLGF
ncbi:MAG: ATP-binding protein [Planktothrix sp.]|uniref:ATP-binding protein n=1 Tax=Planktothrix sp. TaxID=3088171 RepID=UPI0038D35590